MAITKVIKRFEVDCFEVEGTVLVDVFLKPCPVDAPVARNACQSSVFKKMSDADRAAWIAASVGSGIKTLLASQEVQDA